MSNKLPVLFTLSGTDTPLDLRVKKSDMNSSDAPECPTFISKTPVRSSSLPHHLDYFHTESDQRPVFGENMYSDHQSFYSLASSSNSDGRQASSAPGFQGSPEWQYSENPRPSGSPNFDPESGILPKKRKHLWRPYDSQSKMEDNDKDSDSSDSNMSSDHEFRVPLTPPLRADPIKKRKFDRLLYEENQDTEIDNVRAHSPPDHMVCNKDEALEHEGNTYVPVASDPNDASGNSGMNETLSKAQLSLLTNFPESREQMISGMKKRDIFGWSLKLSSPEEKVKNAKLDNSACLDTVCKDGEKTYFELQTVKKGSTSDDNTSDSKQDTNKTDTIKSATVSPRSPQSLTQASSPNRNKVQALNAKNQTLKDESNKENTSNDSESLVGKKVFIHGRDNTIESHDETQNVSKKSDTYKGLSLIDLIEEIEADAVKEDAAQSELERQIKNRRVAALLKQCNYVKLTALDFLMSNVLIEDTEQKRNTKNANIQKMLNGDKISSVSLLDIMEMQVEVGLS